MLDARLEKRMLELDADLSVEGGRDVGLYRRASGPSRRHGRHYRHAVTEGRRLAICNKGRRGR